VPAMGRPAQRRHRLRLVVVGRTAGWPSLGFYGASKHALGVLSEALCYEVARDGLRVVVIEPGSFHTNVEANLLPVDMTSPYADLATRVRDMVVAGVRAGADRALVADAIVGAALDPGSPVHVPVRAGRCRDHHPDRGRRAGRGGSRRSRRVRRRRARRLSAHGRDATGAARPRSVDERPVRCRAMCLLIVISGVVPETPLIVAANRDERRARPTVPMTCLDGGGGRLTIVGGRDEVGGGTWLATNEAGVVAGLTNRPLRDGPDAAKRSRGELPLALARHPTAAAAVEAFRTEVDPGAYNPSWLLVADRHDTFFIDVTGAERVDVEHLPPGVHVLENRDLHERSPKVDRVHELLDPILGARPTELVLGLPTVLADHHVPPGEPPTDTSNPRLAVAARTICVHADEDDYGTRSSAVIAVRDGPAAPTIRWTDDAPCHGQWHTSDSLWEAARTR
jgi:uncharacterized protein with NRDE domain